MDQPTSRASDPGGPRMRVLLADDDECFRLLVDQWFRSSEALSQRADLHCVRDGTEVIQWMHGQGEFADRSACPTPDLILLDERMVRQDGTETLTELKNHPLTSGVPVCLLSSSSVDEWKRRAYADGASICLSKPLSFEELGAKLERLVEFFYDVAALPSEGRSAGA